MAGFFGAAQAFVSEVLLAVDQGDLGKGMLHKLLVDHGKGLGNFRVGLFNVHHRSVLVEQFPQRECLPSSFIS